MKITKQLTASACITAEKCMTGLGRGHERREWVIQYLLNLVPIPKVFGITIPRWILQPLRDRIAHQIAGWIEEIVDYWKHQHGRAWGHVRESVLMTHYNLE